MPSIDDTASDTEEFFLDIARKVRKPELKATGRCLNCEVSVPDGRKFCSPGCKEDDELTQKRNIRNGRS